MDEKKSSSQRVRGQVRRRALRPIRRLAFHLWRWLDQTRERERRAGIADAAARSRDTPGDIGKQTLRKLLPDDAVVIEVGAHVGSDTEQFAIMFPAGRIVACEPVPRLFVQCHERLESYANVTAVPVAIGDRTGLHEFQVSSGRSDASSSLFEPTVHLEHNPDVLFDPRDRLVVPVVTLDELLGAIRIDHVDLLWMDVQGAEAMVVRGAQKILERTRYVYAEVSEVALYKGGATYDELRTQLGNQGFEVLKEFLPADWLGEGNVLFGKVSA